MVLAIDGNLLDHSKLEADENVRIPEDCPECGTPVEVRTDPHYNCMGCDYEFEGDVSWQYTGVIPPNAIKVYQGKVAMTNYIEIWRDILEGSGWEESGWNLFVNPRYPRVSVLLYPRREDGGPLSHKWEVRVDDKPHVSGMSPDRLRTWMYAVKRWEDPNYVEPSSLEEWKEPNLDLTEEDKKWLGSQNITSSFITIPLGQLSPPHTKVAISVPELVAQTNAFSVKRRPGCTPQLTKSDPKQLYLQYNVKCHESYSDPNGHDVRVKFDVSKVQETQKANDLDVQLNCSCPAFLYWGAQWNLHQRDGLLGDPRPELVAPTQHLDLRSNFVICKHCKAVLERILPSVQHNMINIIREETVRKNKEKAKPTPEKLQKEQDAMKQRMEIKKIRQLKNKKIQEKLLEALRQREEKKNGEPEEEMGQPEEPTVVEREQPATTEPTPLTVETPKTEDISQIEPKPEEDMTSMVEARKRRSFRRKRTRSSRTNPTFTRVCRMRRTQRSRNTAMMSRATRIWLRCSRRKRRKSKTKSVLH